MKKILMLTTAVFLSTSALATETTSADTYLSVMGGYTRTDADLEIYGYKLIGDKFNTATLTVEAGKKMNEYLRVGFETAYRYTDLEDWGLKYQMITPSAQLYLDLPNKTLMTPYLNVGAGMNFGWTDDSEDDMQQSFTYNVGAAVNMEVNDNLSLDVKSRYVNVGELYDDYDITVPATGNEFLVGLRYTF